MTQFSKVDNMTSDEKLGIDWWNSLTEVARSYWLSVAGSAVPAEAWAAYKNHPYEATS